MCESLLTNNKIEPFLKQLVTDDEKWTAYNYVNQLWSNFGNPNPEGILAGMIEFY